MKKKIMTLFLALTLVLGLLTGCGGAATGGADMAPMESFDKFQDNGLEMESEVMESGSALYDDTLYSSDGSTGSSSTRPYGDDVKLILRANLTLETTDFDDSVKKLNQLVADCNGYYEQSDVDMGSYYSSGYRYGRYTVRVPKDNYDNFLNAVGEVCHLTSRNESAEDVGLQYYDIESQIRLLEIKQDRLMKLLEQASTMEDIITLENALSDIQYQLEKNNSQKNRYDSLINYSTIEIRLEQVQRLSGEPLEQQSFGSQLVTALKEGILDAVDAFSDLLLTITYNIIPLTIFGLFLFFLRKFVKKRRERRMTTGHNNGSYGNSKKPWIRRKGQTVGETKADGNYIPLSSEDEKK